MSSKNGCIVVLGLLATTMILATIPAVLNLVSRLLRAHYRRVIWRSPTGDPHAEAPAEIDDLAPRVSFMQAKDVAISQHPAGSEAAEATRDVQIALGISAAVYASSVVATILGLVTLKPFASRLAMAYASLGPQLLLVMWTLRVARRQKMWVFLIYGAAGAMLVSLTSADVLQIMTWAPVFALLIIPALLLLIDRVIEPFVILLLPVLFVIFGVGVLLDRTQPEYIRQGEEVLKGIRPWFILFGLSSAIGGFYLVRALLRRRWPARVVASSLALIGLVVLNPTNDRPVPGVIGIVGVIGAVVLQMLIVGALFQFLMSLQDRPILTNELMQVHLAWAWLTLYFELWAWMTDKFVGLRWWFVCAFAAATVALHVLLFLLRRRRPQTAKKRLLLLRAFGGPDERQDLLDDLRDTWQRVGAIDIIVASDVATRTLQPGMLAAFVLRRTGEQFLGSEQAIAKWLEEHRAAIQGDARYPVNPAFCPNHAWKRAFIPLVRSADAVLMDVRDFTMAHKGCVWELKTLRDEKRLGRVVFLANSRTDGQSIVRLLTGHEITMLDFGHRTKDERRALFDQLLNVADT
ncbi:MAG TPA: hypothetical protein VEK57_31230 [Thermoanaerobaculia bacterium]|nr:hypothetical protein [Thermoanaerobaculia bacterium]